MNLIDFLNEKEPLHWAHVIVFGLVVMTVLFIAYTQQPMLVGIEDPNTVELQVVERNEI